MFRPTGFETTKVIAILFNSSFYMTGQTDEIYKLIGEKLSVEVKKVFKNAVKFI